MKFGVPLQIVLVSMCSKFCEVWKLDSQHTGQKVIMGHIQNSLIQ